MLSFFSRKRGPSRSFDPATEVERLVDLGPPWANLTLVPRSGSPEAAGDLGRAFFLRRGRRVYTDGVSLYLTTPDRLKVARSTGLEGRSVVLHFYHRRIPYRMRCTVEGRFRLHPELSQSLDFMSRAALKLRPSSPLQKHDKRQFYRYTVKNYGDGRVPLTTHVSFDCFVKATDTDYDAASSPAALLEDLQVRPYWPPTQPRPFSTREAIEEFRTMMLERPAHDRVVAVTKLPPLDPGGPRMRPAREVVLGGCHILGLEMESLRDVLYLKKSRKAGRPRERDNPHNLATGDRVLLQFAHGGSYYQLLCQVMESRTQQEVLRPLELPVEESGLAIDLVNYSVGGLLVESRPELLEFLLADRCPPDVDEEQDFDSPVWQQLLEELKHRLVHLTFYPRLHFPEALRRFEPELPFRVCVLAQLVRSQVHTQYKGRPLHHGLQFTHEPLTVPLNGTDPVNWRHTRQLQDNECFRRAHTQLSQLYGYLENASLAAGAPQQARRNSPGPRA